DFYELDSRFHPKDGLKLPQTRVVWFVQRSPFWFHGETMNRILLMLLCSLVSLLGAAGVSAQAELPETPLVINVDRGLYAWTPEQGTPTLLVSNSYFITPAVSPDGTEIAYSTYAPLT